MTCFEQTTWNASESGAAQSLALLLPSIGGWAHGRHLDSDVEKIGQIIGATWPEVQRESRFKLVELISTRSNPLEIEGW